MSVFHIPDHVGCILLNYYYASTYVVFKFLHTLSCLGVPVHAIMHVLQLVCMLVNNFPMPGTHAVLFISLYSSIVNVSIEVQDVNDNSPEFINEPYAAVIIEVCSTNHSNTTKPWRYDLQLMIISLLLIGT